MSHTRPRANGIATFPRTMTVECFDTYEDETARLKELAGVHVPLMTAGARAFFGDLPVWLTQGEAGPLDEVTVVLPHPSLNLSLPYAVDEVFAALSVRLGKSPEADDVYAHSAAFELSPSLLQRPVVSLSGGERMLLSLCKAHALQPRTARTCLCSPYFWLDPGKRHLVADQFGQHRAVPTYLLLLDGEFGQSRRTGTTETPGTLEWTLQIDSPEVVFPAQSFPRAVAEKRLVFRGERPALQLRSPTLISGDNGVGKTTLAKLLARLISPSTGGIGVVTGGFGGAARLLLQDTVVQLFGQSVPEHLGRVFRFDRQARKEAIATFQALQRTIFDSLSGELHGVALGYDVPRTMLQCKIGLVTGRLLGGAPLLILDEPGWCLSRGVGRAFVSRVVEEAHRRGIAVALISQQHDWWHGLVYDALELAPLSDRDVTVSHSSRM